MSDDVSRRVTVTDEHGAVVFVGTLVMPDTDFIHLEESLGAPSALHCRVTSIEALLQHKASS